MTDEEIFDLAERHGWMDDFGRWNFKDDGLISFALEVLRVNAEQQEPAFECPRCGHCCKEWVGLTDEEIQSIVNKVATGTYQTSDTFARAIEAKLKEKNNG